MFRLPGSDAEYTLEVQGDPDTLVQSRYKG